MNGQANPFLKVWKGDDVLSFDNMDNRPITKSDDWQKFSIVLNVPKDSTKLSFGFFFTGSGTAWVNGFSLKPVADDVKTTAIPWDPEKFKKYQWHILPKEPVNLDFAMIPHEEGLRQIANWGTHTDDDREYDFFIDRDVVLNKKPSACVTSLINEPKGFGVINQAISADDYLGKRLKLSGYLKTKNVKDWAGLWMRVDGHDSVLAFDNMENRPVKGTADFQPYSIVLDVPMNSKEIKIGAMLAGSGTVWVSNLALDAVSKDVPTTHKEDVTSVTREKLDEQPYLEFKPR